MAKVATSKMKCAICGIRNEGVYHFPHTINDLKRLCEALHLAMPVSNAAHPACITRLRNTILRMRKKRSV